MMLGLLCHKLLLREDLFDMLWPDPDTMPDTFMWLANNRACTLRAKLKPFGYGIQNMTHPPGYQLTGPEPTGTKD